MPGWFGYDTGCAVSSSGPPMQSPFRLIVTRLVTCATSLARIPPIALYPMVLGRGYQRGAVFAPGDTFARGQRLATLQMKFPSLVGTRPKFRVFSCGGGFVLEARRQFWVDLAAFQLGRRGMCDGTHRSSCVV
jgi:hypothetical protein